MHPIMLFKVFNLDKDKWEFKDFERNLIAMLEYLTKLADAIDTDGKFFVVVDRSNLDSSKLDMKLIKCIIKYKKY